MNPQKVHSRQGSRFSMVSKGSETAESVQYDQQIVPYQPSGIAVAVGKGDSSVQALKWTLETLMTSNSGPLHVLHVQDPLRFVQSPLGSLPVNQVNEECLKQAKRQQFCATEKLLQKYRKMCEKKKVEYTVHCVENISIQKAVAEQITKLGISKLVVGSSSRSKLKNFCTCRFLKGPRISVILAQNIPDFCVVMVVCKGRLSSVRDANYSTLTSNSSPLMNTKSGVSMHGSKDTLSEPGVYSPRTNDSLPYWTPSARTDSSLPQWTPSQSTECSSISDAWRREAIHEDVKFMDTFLDHAHGRAFIGKLQSSSKSSMPGTASDHCEPPRIAQPRGSSLESQAMERTILEVQQLRPELMDVKGSFTGATDEAPDSRNKITSELVTKGMEVTHSVTRVNAGVHQLLEMASGLGKTPVRDSPAVLKAKQLHKTSSSFEVMQESGGEKTALRKLETFKSQMLEEIRKRDDLCAFLQEALNASEEKAQEAKANEVKQREEVLNALSNAKIEVAFFKKEADLARQQAAADRVRYTEILAKVDELKKELVKEMELRKNAEERSFKAKQEVARLLRKAQREFMEYSYEDLQLATHNFCEDGKLGEGGYGGVYMGTLNDMTVAVKVLKQAGVDGQQQFQHEVEVLSHIRHPHIVVLLGACQERGYIVYEYLENGSLEDRLTCKDGTPPLPWYVRISICFEVTTALIFLHNLSPNPIVHRDLKPANILLDCNFVSKLSDAGLARWIPENETYNYTVYRETRPAGTFAYMDPEYLRTGSFGPHSDIFALGIVILQLLTGKQAVGVVDLVEAAMNANRLHEVLDQSAGEWPLSEAEDLAKLALRCAEPRRRDRPNLETHVFVTLKRLNELAQKGLSNSPVGRAFYGVDRCGIPRSFVCPLSQEMMRNPHMAADGFTYEYVAIKNWLAHHDVSPMTNLKLAHKQLCKNQSLQSQIQGWNQEHMVAGQPTAEVPIH